MGGLFLLFWVLGPLVLSWATFRWLRWRRPAFRARQFPSLLLGFTLNLIGTLALLFAVGNQGYWVEVSSVLLPVVGTALGYYATSSSR